MISNFFRIFKKYLSGFLIILKTRHEKFQPELNFKHLLRFQKSL